MGKIKNKDKNKLWNKNFFLLWQGQLVSVLGDVIYTMALDFWILDVTGSTALMGLLSACTMIPRIVLGPFAGVWVDKWDRKKIIVLTDLIRGIFVTFVGIAALGGFIKVWMVFVVGIIGGLNSAFFGPAISSSRPDIVPEEKLMKANSVTSLAESGMNMLGSAIGGVLYAAIGAPYMFLFNGISYLFSAFTEVFIKIPKVKREDEEITFVEDFKIGFKFLWNFKALRNTCITSALINFFFNAAAILMVAYFKEMEFLGVERYGVAMTILALGMMAGSVTLSVVNIKRQNKFKTFKGSLLIFCIGMLFMPLVQNYGVLLVILFISFFMNAVLNTIFSTTMMQVIPSDIRGKVISIVSTLNMGLTPLGTLLGGFLGEFIPVKIVLIGLFVCSFAVGMAMINVKGASTLIEYDSEESTLNSLIQETNAC